MRLLLLCVTTSLPITSTAVAHAESSDDAPSESLEPAPAPSSPPTPRASSVTFAAQGNLPIGDFAKHTGPQLGPVVRGAVAVGPSVGVVWSTGLLVGTTIGGPVTIDGRREGSITKGVTVIPQGVGMRVAPHTFQNGGGPYIDATVTLNVLYVHNFQIDYTDSALLLRVGAGLRAGWLLSRRVPIDLAADVSLHNWLPRVERPEPADHVPMATAGLVLGVAWQRD